MRRIGLSAVCAAIGMVAFSGAATAQTPTLPYDHVHLNVPDPAAASVWYETNLRVKS